MLENFPVDMTENDVSYFAAKCWNNGSPMTTCIGKVLTVTRSVNRSQLNSELPIMLMASRTFESSVIARRVSEIGRPLLDRIMSNTVSHSIELSKQLGFLRFPTIDESRAFVERNHRGIYLYGPSAGPNDRSTKVRIAYSREREDRNRAKGEGDWMCRMVCDFWCAKRGRR